MRCSRSSPSMEAIDHLAAAFRNVEGEYYWNESDRVATSSSAMQRLVQKPMSLAFTSFIEADIHLEGLVGTGEDLRNELVSLAQAHVSRVYGTSLDSILAACLANCLSRSLEIPGHLQCRLDDIARAHISWLTKLRTLCSQKGTTSNPILLLTQIRYFASWLVISTCRETKETLVDRFEQEFLRVLDLTEQYMRQTSDHVQPEPPPQMRNAVRLSLEGGILPALHLIACKSRSSSIRRRAKNILCSMNRLELTCQSGVIGSVVGAVAILEEREARTMQSSSSPTVADFTSAQVPEHARYSDFVFQMGSEDPSSSQRPSFRLACARFLHDKEGRIEVSEYCDERRLTSLQWQSGAVFDCSAQALSAAAASNDRRV